MVGAGVGTGAWRRHPAKVPGPAQQLHGASPAIRRTWAVRLQQLAHVTALAQGKGPGHARPAAAARNLRGGAGGGGGWGKGTARR